MSNMPAKEDTLALLRASLGPQQDYRKLVANAVYELNDDRFADMNPCGWGPLATPDPTTDQDARGTVQPYARGADNSCLQLMTSETAGLSAFGSVMAIKRQMQWEGYGVYLLDFWESLNYGFQGQQRVSALTSGFDTANVNGERFLFALRYFNYDETAQARVGHWQIERNGAWSTILANHPMQSNENKDLVYRVRMLIDTTPGSENYLGIMINNFFKWGLFADVPSIPAGAGPTKQSLITFEDGCNPLLEGRNRTDTSATDLTARLHRQRTLFLGSRARVLALLGIAA